MEIPFSARLMRSVAVSIATLMATFTFAVAAPTPASAATKVTFCNAVPNSAVTLTYFDFQVRDWLPYRNGRSNAAGCGTFLNTRSDLFLQVESRVQVASGGVNSVWNGVSERWAPRGNFGYSVLDLVWTRECSQCSLD